MGGTATVAPPGGANASIQDVVVTARHREEKLQDVPIPATVIGGDQLDRDQAVNLKDFTQKAPNLLVNAPNARQTSIAIRGVGKNTANDAMESSVGVIVDNVFLGQVGMSWTDFVDVDSIEVLRGPQGTLNGKNTTLGLINITTKPPSFTPEGQFEQTIANRNTYITKGAVSGPLIDDKLAYRASFFYDSRDGFLDNLFRDDQTFLGSNKWGRARPVPRQADGRDHIARHLGAREDGRAHKRQSQPGRPIVLCRRNAEDSNLHRSAQYAI